VLESSVPQPHALCTFHCQIDWTGYFTIQSIQMIRRPVYLGKKMTSYVSDSHDSPIDHRLEATFVQLTHTDDAGGQSRNEVDAREGVMLSIHALE
jgi:hypothetical protein